MKKPLRFLLCVFAVCLAGCIGACGSNPTSQPSTPVDDTPVVQPDNPPVVEHVHNYGTLVEYDSSSCPDTPGHIAYYHCEECGKYFDEDKNEVESIELPPAASHEKKTSFYICAGCRKFILSSPEQLTSVAKIRRESFNVVLFPGEYNVGSLRIEKDSKVESQQVFNFEIEGEGDVVINAKSLYVGKGITLNVVTENKVTVKSDNIEIDRGSELNLTCRKDFKLECRHYEVDTGARATVIAEEDADVTFDGQLNAWGEFNGKNINFINNLSPSDGTAYGTEGYIAFPHDICVFTNGSLNLDSCLITIVRNDELPTGIYAAVAPDLAPYDGEGPLAFVNVKNTVFDCNGSRPIQARGDVSIDGCTFNSPYYYAAQFTSDCEQRTTAKIVNSTVVDTRDYQEGRIQRCLSFASGETFYNRNVDVIFDNVTYKGKNEFHSWYFAGTRNEEDTFTFKNAAGEEIDKLIVEADPE